MRCCLKFFSESLEIRHAGRLQQGLSLMGRQIFPEGLQRPEQANFPRVGEEIRGRIPGGKGRQHRRRQSGQYVRKIRLRQGRVPENFQQGPSPRT